MRLQARIMPPLLILDELNLAVVTAGLRPWALKVAGCIDLGQLEYSNFMILRRLLNNRFGMA